MRETDLDTIDEPVPSTLEDSEVVVVGWVGEYMLNAGHRRAEERTVYPSSPTVIATVKSHATTTGLDSLLADHAVLRLLLL